MATWITHLRIAEKLLKNIPGLDARQFAIGNIAPDSGIPNEDWEKFDPPKEITHYLTEDEESEYVYRDMDFFRQVSENQSNLNNGDKRFTFLLGYFFHLITDNLWLRKIGRPAKEKYLSTFESKTAFFIEIKKDWYGLDFVFMRRYPDSIFWQIFLDSYYSEQFLDLFPSEAIPRQLDYIKNFYQRVDDQVDQDYRLKDNIYLSEEAVNIFVKESVQTLVKVYKLLWVRKVEIYPKNSILEIIEI